MLKVALVALVLAASAAAAPKPPLRLVQVVPASKQATHVAAPLSEPGRLYVAGRAGVVRVVDRGRLRQTPFLDLSRRVAREGERGLLSIAFPRDYAQKKLVYVCFTNRDGTIIVAEYRVEGDRALASSERILLQVAHDESPYHNGGQIAFGPDGLLYLTTGDGGYIVRDPDPHGNSQNRNVLLGKIVRIDPSSTSPAPELVAYGLRNPWRLSFDRATGDLYVADVGWKGFEEVNYLPAETRRLVNFGWSVYEGTRKRDTDVELDPTGELVYPIHTYATNDRRNCSIVGGFVYRGRAVARLRGRYVFGDFCSGRIWSLRVEDGHARDVREEPVRVEGLVSFGEDAAGELYAVRLNGAVYRFAA